MLVVAHCHNSPINVFQGLQVYPKESCSSQCSTILISQSVLLYVNKTRMSWTVLTADEWRLEAFHMKCQRQITKICWQDHTRNSEVAARTSLRLLSDLITRRQNSVFGHIARLPEDMPAHQALRCHVDLTLGYLPDQSWKRHPGRPTTDGLTSYAGTTTTRHQLTCREGPPHVVIREWRYGPRRLRVDNDDDESECAVSDTISYRISDYFSYFVVLLMMQAISNPRSDDHQDRAWQSVVPLVSQLKQYYDFSLSLGNFSVHYFVIVIIISLVV